MIKKRVRATVHGAISIVNALATCGGSALGISLRVTAEADLNPGKAFDLKQLTRNLYAI